MPEYRRYNLTLNIVDPSARDRFRSLSRPETFFEFRLGRSPGQRGAYSVEMTQDEYEAALEDAEAPGVDLIAVEPDQVGVSAAVPAESSLSYLAASEAADLELIVTLKAVKDFSNDPYAEGDNGHGMKMAGLAVPAGARAVAASYGENESAFVAAAY